jgi:hypothetical protein
MKHLLWHERTLHFARKICVYVMFYARSICRLCYVSCTQFIPVMLRFMPAVYTGCVTFHARSIYRLCYVSCTQFIPVMLRFMPAVYTGYVMFHARSIYRLCYVSCPQYIPVISLVTNVRVLFILNVARFSKEHCFQRVLFFGSLPFW